MIISDVVIEHAPNPYFDEPCPSCGDPFDVARDCLIGVALHGRARLCTACINSVMPEATKTLELVADLQCLLEESTDKAAFITSSVALLTRRRSRRQASGQGIATARYTARASAWGSPPPQRDSRDALNGQLPTKPPKSSRRSTFLGEMKPME